MLEFFFSFLVCLLTIYFLSKCKCDNSFYFWKYFYSISTPEWYVFCGYNSYLKIIYSFSILKFCCFSLISLVALEKSAIRFLTFCVKSEILKKVSFHETWPLLFISGVLKFHNKMPRAGPYAVFARHLVAFSIWKFMCLGFSWGDADLNILKNSSSPFSFYTFLWSSPYLSTSNISRVCRVKFLARGHTSEKWQSLHSDIICLIGSFFLIHSDRLS